jgi:hypothetical protein
MSRIIETLEREQLRDRIPQFKAATPFASTFRVIERFAQPDNANARATREWLSSCLAQRRFHSSDP